jgi:hypothetical protein
VVARGIFVDERRRQRVGCSVVVNRAAKLRHAVTLLLALTSSGCDGCRSARQHQAPQVVVATAAATAATAPSVVTGSTAEPTSDITSKIPLEPEGVRLSQLPDLTGGSCPRLNQRAKKRGPPVDVSKKFKDSDTRFAEMLARIAKGREALVIGLLESSGLTAMGDLKGGNRISFGVSPWHEATRPIDRRLLYVYDTKPVSDEVYHERGEAFPGNSIVRIKVRFDPQSIDDVGVKRVDAQLIELISIDNDDMTMVEAVKRLSTPVVVDDPFFGRLVLNREYARYEGQHRFGNGSYEIAIDCDDCDGSDKSITEEYRSRAKCLEANLGTLGKIVVDKMYPLYVDAWEESSAKPLSRDGFIARIRLVSLSLKHHYADLYLDDGGLFEGHLINVMIDEDYRVEVVSLAG